MELLIWATKRATIQAKTLPILDQSLCLFDTPPAPTYMSCWY